MCVMSCSKRTDNRSLFYAMAKDLYKDQNIASNFLDTINVSSFNKEEQMYGELLKIQATDLTDHDIKPYEKNISRIINYMQNKKDYTFLKLALYYAGRIKSEKDEAMKAVNFYTKAASIKDTILNINNKCYSQLGNIYYDQYLYDYAIDMYTKAYNEAFIAKDDIAMVKILKDKALVLLDKGETTLALKLLKKALKMAEHTKDIRCINSVKSYCVIAYTDKRDWGNAQKLLPDILHNINKADSSAVYFIAANLYKQTDISKANMLYSFLKNKGNIYAKEEAYKFLTKESLGKEKNFESIKFFERYTHIVDSIRRNTNSEMMAKIKGLYDYQKQKERITKISKEKNEFKLLFASTTVFLLLVTTFAFLLISRLRRRAQEEKRQVFMLKKLQDEMRQNSLEKIKENNKRIDELELQLINATNEKDELKKRLADEKEKLLAQNAINKLKIEEENRALGSIKNTDIGIMIQKKKRSETKEYLTKEERKQMEDTFDQFMPSFKEKLWSVYDISNRELNVCMLIKLGCKPADMACLLGCTPSAISKIRIRLYKKFFNKLGSAEDWDRFILSL